jgi:hypothetical protein
MKQILPILTLTTLTAAAFADAGAAAPAAAASGLNYNRVSISRSSDSTNFAVSNLLNGGNVLVTIASGSNGEGISGSNTNAEQIAVFSVGYVFKNVAAGIDATVSVGSSTKGSNTGSQSGYGVNLRRSLSEVVPGLEAALAYGHSKSSGNDSYTTMSYELSYNINKQFSVAYGIVDPNGAGNSNIHIASLRYNY